MKTPMTHTITTPAPQRRAPKPRLVTWLDPCDRARVDAATGDQLTPVHVDALPAVLDSITTGQTEAVMLSASRVQTADVPMITRLVRGFPSIPVAGFVGESDNGSRAISGALLLGQAGVRVVLDCRVPGGWAALRNTFHPRRMPDAFLRSCVASVLDDIRTEGAEACAEGLVRFFTLVFKPDVTSAKVIGTQLGVRSCTLMSRFYRAGLPSPKRYLTWARLVWAARLAESSGLSISAIADRLDASSPQSFHRTVRLLTGHTAAEFRRMVTGTAMLEQYRETLVTPYRDTLRSFDPLGVTSACSRAPERAPQPYAHRGNSEARAVPGINAGRAA